VRERTRVASSVTPGALEAAYREHVGALKRVAFLLTGSNAAADDVVHDVFLRCADRLDALDHPASYLRAAVVNECRSIHRHNQRFATNIDPDRTDALPEDVVETLDALARLGDRQRAAIVLRYFVDVPDAEIARFLSCRPSTVRSLVRRGVAELREVLR
jgi:RNA polymerase sigma factor (sigma-70 family)